MTRRFGWLRAAALMAGLASLAVAQGPGPYQGGYERERGGPRQLVGKTQSDLQAASQFATTSQRERERLDNALKHLSQFDQRLMQRRFDKGKLDSAIGDVQNVVDHNTLSPRDRDALTFDLRRLRDMRAFRGAIF